MGFGFRFFFWLRVWELGGLGYRMRVLDLGCRI